MHLPLLIGIEYCDLLKGGITLASTGYINVNAYTSIGRIPLSDALIILTDTQGQSVAFRLTDRSGKITPIALQVPDDAASLTPEADGSSFASFHLLAFLEGYGTISVENLQVFAGQTTLQPLDFIPLSEYPGQWDGDTNVLTPPQDL